MVALVALCNPLRSVFIEAGAITALYKLRGEVRSKNFGNLDDLQDALHRAIISLTDDTVIDLVRKVEAIGPLSQLNRGYYADRKEPLAQLVCHARQVIFIHILCESETLTGVQKAKHPDTCSRCTSSVYSRSALGSQFSGSFLVGP
jgi:hypothetical protein